VLRQQIAAAAEARTEREKGTRERQQKGSPIKSVLKQLKLAVKSKTAKVQSSAGAFSTCQRPELAVCELLQVLDIL